MFFWVLLGVMLGVFIYHAGSVTVREAVEKQTLGQSAAEVSFYVIHRGDEEGSIRVGAVPSHETCLPVIQTRKLYEKLHLAWI